MFRVYRLLSPSGKSYIGLTSRTFEKRWAQHVIQSRGKDKSCKKLCNAFQKYPPETWKREVLFECSDKLTAQQKEIELIGQFDSINNGYNILRGGQLSRLGLKPWNLGVSHTTETKKKISLSKIGTRLTEETKQKISKAIIGNKNSLGHKNRLGQSPSEATRAKISSRNSGKHRSEDFKDKMRVRMLGNKFGVGNKNCVGRIISEETRAKMSAALGS